MNLANMTLKELKALRREIADEIEEREERELSEFKELIRAYLGDKKAPTKTLPEIKTVNSNDNLISVDKLSERLGVPKSQIYRLTTIGTIPVIKLGKYNRYDYEEVLGALNKKGAID